jgi:hypothetical protein
LQLMLRAVEFATASEVASVGFVVEGGTTWPSWGPVVDLPQVVVEADAVEASAEVEPAEQEDFEVQEADLEE